MTTATCHLADRRGPGGTLVVQTPIDSLSGNAAADEKISISKCQVYTGRTEEGICWNT
jgi:hypothetical protein